jgi:hypothetical protein
MTLYAFATAWRGEPTVFAGVPAPRHHVSRHSRGRDSQGRGQTFQKGLDIVSKVKQRSGINIGPIVFRELHQRLGGNLRFIGRRRRH